MAMLTSLLVVRLVADCISIQFQGRSAQSALRPFFIPVENSDLLTKKGRGPEARPF
jgi:hypothetical protein